VQFRDIGLRHRGIFKVVHVKKDLVSLQSKNTFGIFSHFFKVVLLCSTVEEKLWILTSTGRTQLRDNLYNQKTRSVYSDNFF
jgi:hypothetical protein